MTDLDRPQTSATQASATRTAAWILLAACAAGNLILSARGGPLVVHLAVGLATLLCLTTLAVTYLRRTP